MTKEALNTPQKYIAKWVQPFNAINLFIKKSFQKKSQQTIAGISKYKHIRTKIYLRARPTTKLIHKREVFHEHKKKTFCMGRRSIFLLQNIKLL